MSILNFRKRDVPSAAHSHVTPDSRFGMSVDPLIIAMAVLSTVAIIAGGIGCIVYLNHVGTVPPDHHYQCVDKAGQPADDSECSRPSMPFIPFPVIT